MDDDGNTQDAGCREVAAVTEVALAVEVTHGTGDGKVGRYGGEATHDAGAYPVFALEQVEDILGSCKSQADTGGIDDPVEVFVIVGILAQENPQHGELGDFLGHGGGKQGGRDSAHIGAQVIDHNAHHPHDGRNHQGEECRAHAIEEGLEKHLWRLGAHGVLAIDPPAQQQSRQQCSGNNQ